MKDKKEFIKEFERATNLGKAKAYSKISLERPLTDKELLEYKGLVNSLAAN